MYPRFSPGPKVEQIPRFLIEVDITGEYFILIHRTLINGGNKLKELPGTRDCSERNHIEVPAADRSPVYLPAYIELGIDATKGYDVNVTGGDNRFNVRELRWIITRGVARVTREC